MLNAGHLNWAGQVVRWLAVQVFLRGMLAKHALRYIHGSLASHKLLPQAAPKKEAVSGSA